MQTHHLFTILTVRIGHMVYKDLNNISNITSKLDQTIAASQKDCGVFFIDNAQQILNNNQKDAEVQIMRNRTKFTNLLMPLAIVTMLLSVACDYAAITAPEAPISANVASATSVDEINWVSWNPEVVERVRAQQLSSLSKLGERCDENQSSDDYDCRVIIRKEGGKVGNGRLTSLNKVKIPANALHKKGKFGVGKEANVSVELISPEDEDLSFFLGVEFTVYRSLGKKSGEAFAHYEFRKDVRITLSYAQLDLDGVEDPTTLSIYWQDSVGDGWLLLEDLSFNPKRKTVSFWVDHFTRYGWAF